MRAGTTFLHAALLSHPDVVSGTAGEHQFFSLRYAEGLGAYRAQLPWRWPNIVHRTIGVRRPLVIDCSPYYLYHPVAPERVKALPGSSMKAIVLLREPGERAWSHYRLNLARGQEYLGFLEAIEAEQERLAGEHGRIVSGREEANSPHQVFSYIGRGRYAGQLEHWWRAIPRDRFLLLRSDDLFDHTANIVARVYDFLGLAPFDGYPRIPRNGLPYLPLPPRARAALDQIFARPNSELHALTGISFG